MTIALIIVGLFALAFELRAITSQFIVGASASVGGQVFSQQINKSGPDANLRSVTVPAAQQGVLTTRTDNTDGVITIAGNTIPNAVRVDVYWNGGWQKGCTTSVTGNAVTISGGTGTNLPAATTVVQVCQCVEVSFNMVGNNVLALWMSSPVLALFDFVSSVPADILDSNIFPGGAVLCDAGGFVAWNSPVVANAGYKNPVAGQTGANLWLSHNDITGPQVLMAAVQLSA